ncbi:MULTISPECIES: phytanoyl-CoA dioxygenase family protein [Sphingomonas]|uniref:phytanoyl-CoA dioxygenase family protein n=1 Tax=Sphingomonas TaxID=13687 RepID=UPI000DEF5D6E|nr:MULTISPECIES: phytanoyl-CoA dioxygenase family protein [Sphingomonas]
MAAGAIDVAAIMGGLYGDGIIGCPGAFTAEWADRMAADVWRVWERVKDRPGGALPRGPHRFYVEVAPEDLSGFVDIVTHPWFVAVCEAVLTKDYRIVEVGFDIPFPGAEDQPWHRDFAAPAETLAGRRLNSLAFNLTCVDTRPEHGPFEIAPGTQWDAIEGAKDGMFPEPAGWERYEQRAVRKLPRRGDMAARSALTIHRGTANRSNEPRPVVVVGVDAPGATNAAHHDLQVTRAYLDALPARVRDHLTCRVVDRVTMIEQHHVIEGLL